MRGDERLYPHLLPNVLKWAYRERLFVISMRVFDIFKTREKWDPILCPSPILSKLWFERHIHAQGDPLMVLDWHNGKFSSVSPALHLEFYLLVTVWCLGDCGQVWFLAVTTLSFTNGLVSLMTTIGLSF